MKEFREAEIAKRLDQGQYKFTNSALNSELSEPENTNYNDWLNDLIA